MGALQQLSQYQISDFKTKLATNSGHAEAALKAHEIEGDFSCYHPVHSLRINVLKGRNDIRKVIAPKIF